MSTYYHSVRKIIVTIEIGRIIIQNPTLHHSKAAQNPCKLFVKAFVQPCNATPIRHHKTRGKLYTLCISGPPLQDPFQANICTIQVHWPLGYYKGLNYWRRVLILCHDSTGTMIRRHDITSPCILSNYLILHIHPKPWTRPPEPRNPRHETHETTAVAMNNSFPWLTIGSTPTQSPSLSGPEGT